MLGEKFLTLLAENVEKEPNLEAIQRKIRLLYHWLPNLDIRDKRDQFRRLLVPILEEILSWQEKEEKEIEPFIFRVVDGLSEPKPALPIKQYVLIALYIGFLIGSNITQGSNIELRLRKKEFLAKSKELAPINCYQSPSLKIDSMELFVSTLCFLFIIVSILENKNFLIFRFKLLIKTIKKIRSRKNKDSFNNSPHSLYLFEIYG
jgi:hypothetical protein